MQMVSQSLVILLLSISMMIRGDIFALVYLVFVVRMMTVSNRTLSSVVAQ